MAGPPVLWRCWMTEATGPDVGDSAPSFSLRRTFEEKVSLDELLAGHRPLLLAFYVFDFGSV
jgi:peroxiredoxin